MNFKKTTELNLKLKCTNFLYTFGLNAGITPCHIIYWVWGSKNSKLSISTIDQKMSDLSKCPRI